MEGLWAVDPKRTNAGLTKIYKKQGEYNKALTDAGLAGRVPLIRSSEMSRQIQGCDGADEERLFTTTTIIKYVSGTDLRFCDYII